MKLVLPFTVGIIIGWLYPFSFLLVYSGVTLLVLIFMICIAGKRWQLIRDFLLVILCTGFGILKITYDARYTAGSNVARFRWPEGNVVLKGIVIDEPLQSEHSVKFVVDAESVIVQSRGVKVTGHILISWRRTERNYPDLDSFRCGVRVSLSGQMAGMNPIRNPGEFDYGSYLKLNNIDGRFYAASLDSTCITGKGTNGIYARFVNPVRRSIVGKIDTLIGGEEARFLRGLLIGERSDIPLEVKSAFINAGVMHVVAVSGLHVVIVAAMIVILLQFFRVPDRWRSAVTGILLVYYALLTGGTPSVVRSVIMAIIYLGAKCIERRVDIYNVLAVSAMIILCIDSRLLFHPGFQLSFVSVLSIVYLYPRINIFSKIFRDKNRLLKFVSFCWSLFAVSLSAAIGTGPFVSMYFGKISLIGIIANIIVVPLSNAVLAVGMITIGISYLSMAVASVYAEVTRVLTTIMLDIVQMFGNLPFAYIQSNISYISSIIFYVLVGLCIMVVQKSTMKRALILFLVLINMLIYWNIFYRPEGKLRVAFLDVGQGDAIVIEFPGGKTVIVDAGPQSLYYNTGERVVLPYLRARGIGSIDKLVITHPDADHMGGCAALLRGVDVGEVLDGGINPTGLLQSNFHHLVDSLELKRTIIGRGVKYGECSLWRMYILHPAMNKMSEGTYDNEGSVVVRIVYGGTSLLLTGDIHSGNEMELIRTYGSFLESDILKLAHHGSISSTSAEFLQGVRPEMSVISVGKRNRFNHPSPVVLDRLKNAGCSYLRTDEEGALIFESDGKKWKRFHWR